MLAFLAASSTLASFASGLAILILFAMVSRNSIVSCVTYDDIERRSSVLISLISFSDISIWPSFTSQNLIMSFKSVDFPEPLAPCIPSTLPFSISTVTFLNIISSSYEKVISSALAPSKSVCSLPPTSSTGGASSSSARTLSPQASV